MQGARKGSEIGSAGYAAKAFYWGVVRQNHIVALYPREADAKYAVRTYNADDDRRGRAPEYFVERFCLNFKGTEVDMYTHSIERRVTSRVVEVLPQPPEVFSHSAHPVTITQKEFRKIKTGDVLKVGRNLRRVMQATAHHLGTGTCMVVFEKLIGHGTTAYNWYDLKFTARVYKKK